MGKPILGMSDHTRLKINRLRTLISNGIAGHVWAALFGGCQIVGPYFFEGNVNGNSYLAMLNEFLVPNIRDQLGVGNIIIVIIINWE
jgi:hypothetical protein